MLTGGEGEKGRGEKRDQYEKDDKERLRNRDICNGYRQIPEDRETEEGVWGRKKEEIKN